MKQYAIYYDSLIKDLDITNTFKTVEQIDSCQAWIISYHDNITGKLLYTILQSYNTLVAGIIFKYGDNKLICNGTYSQTTRQHIGKFANKYGYSYYDFKEVITK